MTFNDMPFVAMPVLIFTIVMLVNIILSGIIVFFERRNPASSWAWLLVLFFVPVFGFLIYVIFGRNSKREKMFADKEKYDSEVYYDYLLTSKGYYEKITSQRRTIESGGDLTGYNDLNGLAHLNIITGNWMTDNNSVELFNDGVSKFNALIEDIRGAEKYIHMEYYIIRGDNLGRTIVSELEKRARDGVEVRLLYDGMGCARLPASFFDSLRAAGGYVAAFLPPFFVRINYRNHRKLCVIDGSIGYVGGFNIGDEYMGLVKRYGNWRDTHIRIKGDAVEQLQMRFVMDWNFTSKKHEVELTGKYFPQSSDCGNVKMQIVSSGPDNKWKNIRNSYFKMINEAKSHIYISTPYFVPDDAIFEAIKVASLAGKDVRIIIPGNPDHFFVYWASMSYLGELLDAGVRCYQYENGFLHTKVISVDGLVSSVGTANMDVRSFGVNFEVNSFIFDREVAGRIERDFMNDLESSIEITPIWYNSRRAWFKVKESVARLISPML